MLKKNCLQCNKLIEKPIKITKARWIAKKYCSNKCTSTNRKLSTESRLKISRSLLGNIPWNKNKKTNVTPWNKGLTYFLKKNPGYEACHSRVRKIKGQPNKCEHCKTTTSKVFDWANISKKYNDINDYVRLCRSCHCKFDNTIKNTKA